MEVLDNGQRAFDDSRGSVTTVYLCVDGASQSSRKKQDTLEQIVRNVTSKDPCVILHSLFKSRTRKKLDWFFNLDHPCPVRVVIVCKSQGAWRVLDYLERHHAALKGRDIRVVSIDPHHWAEPILPRNPAASFDTVNIYQDNYWPCGFAVDHAHNIRIDRAHIDHWNIIHHDAVRAAILRAGGAS
jgi:hypothetical protein